MARRSLLLRRTQTGRNRGKRFSKVYSFISQVLTEKGIQTNEYIIQKNKQKVNKYVIVSNIYSAYLSTMQRNIIECYNGK